MSRRHLQYVALVCLIFPTSVGATPLVRGAAEAVEAAKETTPQVTLPEAPRRKRHTRRRHPKLAQLQDSYGLKVRTPRHAWGTKLTVGHLTTVCARYQEHFPESEPIWVHDLSTRRGGRLKPHKSHTDGRDVDIRMVLNRKTKNYVRATPRTIDRERMFYLLKQLIDTEDVEVIFLDKKLQRVLYRYARQQGYTDDQLRPMFQFPFGWGATIRHAKGHDDHIHVRFRRKSKRIPVA